MDEETKQLIFQTAKNVEALMGIVGSLETNVGGLTSDVSTLKSDVSTLMSDVSTLKEDVSTLKSDVRTLTIRADVMDFKLDDMHAEIDLGFSITNDCFEKLTTHIDGFAAKAIRTDQELAAGLHRDDRLEERILTLERRALYGR